MSEPSEETNTVSDALHNSLQSRINELTNELASVRTEAKGRRVALKAREAEMTSVLAERDALKADRDTWKGKAEAAPGEKDKRIAELEGSILTREHGDAFEALKADKALGLNPKFPSASLMRELGYTPEGPADPAKLKLLVETAKSNPALSHLFGGPADAGMQASQGGPPGPGTNRGGSPNGPSAGTVTRAQLADPAWMFHNQPMAAKAVAEGRLID